MYLLKNVDFPLLCWFTRGDLYFFTTILLELKLWKNLSTLHEGFFSQVKALKKVTLETPQKGTMKISYNDSFLQEFFHSLFSSLWDFHITNPPKTWGEMKFALENEKKRTAKLERTVRRGAEGHSETSSSITCARQTGAYQLRHISSQHIS